MMSAIQILNNTDPMKTMFDLGKFSLEERAILLKIYDMATGEQPDLRLFAKVQKLDELFLEVWKAECTRQYLFNRFGKKYAGDFEIIVDGYIALKFDEIDATFTEASRMAGLVEVID